MVFIAKRRKIYTRFWPPKSLINKVYTWVLSIYIVCGTIKYRMITRGTHKRFIMLPGFLLGRFL